MLQRLIRSSLRFRGIVLALACVTLGYGMYVARNSRYDVYPEFVPPQVVVQTEAPGLSPEEVEVLVTRPVESVLNGTPELASIRSQSIQGLSSVTMIFADRTDIFRARQMVSERLAEAAGQMPAGVKSPVMAPLTGAASLVLIVGLTSEERTPMDLRTFADWTIRPRLLGVPGVAKVVVFGGETREIQIQVLPDRLAGYNLSMDDVIAAGRASTGVRGAGFVEGSAQRVLLQAQGQALNSEMLGEAVLGRSRGTTIRLRDVAHVVDAPEPKTGDAAVGEKRGVLLEVSSQYGANTLEVTAALERALEDLKPALDKAGIQLHPRLFRPAKFVQTAISNVSSSLMIGGGLVAIVLFLFLFNLRTAVISITAIPLSLLAAVIVLNRLGQSLNTLTLGGLAIAIGEVVDDAIVDVENIFRRLRENARAGSPQTAFKVALDASMEVRGAVIYATFVVALVFLPILTMSGIQGRLFAPLGWTYIMAIMASLLVALTVTPALASFLLPGTAAYSDEPRLVQALKSGYRGVLVRIGERPGPVMACALVLIAAAAAALPFMGGTFLPDLREGSYVLHMSCIPGTSLEESLRVGRAVTHELLANPRIASVAQQVGRAEKADDIWGSHYSEFYVNLRPLTGEEGERVETEIRDSAAKFPGAYFAIRTFLAERIEEVISGVNAEVVIKIYGEDLDAIDRKAREVAKVISGVRGAAEVQVESPAGAPETVIRLRPERLKQFGFQPLPVLDTIQAAYQGVQVAQTFEGNRVFNVGVILDQKFRNNPEAIGNLVLRNPEGLRMPLRELSDVYSIAGRYSILHDGTRRRQAVTCNVLGRDLAGFVDEAKRQVRDRVALPAGIYYEFTGAAEARRSAQKEILIYSLLAGTGIVALLFIAFRRTRNLLLVLVNLPFALVGGVLAIIATGGLLTVGSLVGLVTLFGITMRNSIMMVSHFEHLVTEEGMSWGTEAALRGASERLLPILMTATVTALGLLPLALGSGEAGREIEGPMAVAILGGLFTSTLLNLLILPTLALRYARFDRDAGIE